MPTDKSSLDTLEKAFDKAADDPSCKAVIVGFVDENCRSTEFINGEAAEAMAAITAIAIDMVSKLPLGFRRRALNTLHRALDKRFDDMTKEDKKDDVDEKLSKLADILMDALRAVGSNHEDED